VSAFVHQLADKVGAGQVSLLQGQQNITVEIPQNVTLELQLEDEDKGRKGIQHSLKIEIKWFDQDDQEGGGGSVQLE
jgi:amphi-Trp domain-containing protein